MHSTKKNETTIDSTFAKLIKIVYQKAKSEGISDEVVEDEIEWIKSRRTFLKNIEDSHHKNRVCNEMEEKFLD